MEKILGSLLVSGFALPWYFTQQATGSVPAGFSAGLGGLALTVIILLWLSVQRDRFQAELRRRRDLKRAASEMALVDQMSGVEFEEFVASQLRTRGWGLSAGAGQEQVVFSVCQPERVQVQLTRSAPQTVRPGVPVTGVPSQRVPRGQV